MYSIRESSPQNMSISFPDSSLNAYTLGVPPTLSKSFLAISFLSYSIVSPFLQNHGPK